MNKLNLLLILLLILSIKTFGTNSKTSREYANFVIKKINQGDKNILKNISYKKLSSAFQIERDQNHGELPLGNRGKVINSALKGLFSIDPRVRLLSIEILRKMKPDRFMAPEVDLAFKNITTFLLSDQDKQYQFKDYYIYQDINGNQVKKSLIKELRHLYYFVQRDWLVNKMKHEDGNILTKINHDQFLVLVRQIDNEPPRDIPFKAFGENTIFHQDQLMVIINGLESKILNIRQECALYLINYYNYNNNILSLYYRNRIKTALKKAYDDDIISKPKLIR